MLEGMRSWPWMVYCVWAPMGRFGQRARISTRRLNHELAPRLRGFGHDGHPAGVQRLFPDLPDELLSASRRRILVAML